MIEYVELFQVILRDMCGIVQIDLRSMPMETDSVDDGHRWVHLC